MSKYLLNYMMKRQIAPQIKLAKTPIAIHNINTRKMIKEIKSIKSQTSGELV